MDVSSIYAEAVRTAFGFFWKAGWAFVLGYTISAAIQAFVPKARLSRRMGRPDVRSTALAAVFGAISSSCSFAALATARSLVLKGAHFVAAVAFMFASTNLVIELGILIASFLGWQFLVAELAGGLVLIVISSLLIRATYPRRWLEHAREKVEAESESEEDDFDWKERIRSFDGWALVGRRFVMEWAMVWREILVGFTVAGFITVLVPDHVWKSIFLADLAARSSASFWVVLENAAVSPLVAAVTFIGSMGNIPLATVLASSGVLFAGTMGFIYSDLMVPPLVRVNAKYYGWPVALYVAAVMYASIVATALLLHYAFLASGSVPHAATKIGGIVRFGVDYTLFLNVAAVVVASGMVWLSWAGMRDHERHQNENAGAHLSPQAVVTDACVAVLAGGVGVLVARAAMGP